MGSAAPSMMQTFGSSMAGSIAGNAIYSAFSGGRGGEQQAPPPQEQAGQAQAPYYAPTSNGQSFEPQQGDACYFESKQFADCMKQTNNDVNQCQYLFESLRQCQAAYAPQQ
eukprot:GFYU01005499.1.p2 GENE.GFYU01005499.1~~GFYU01005499.1.p2  ORF type:complete len:111 (-),score=40.73 GFYU01005499.1:216-548(-)